MTDAPAASGPLSGLIVVELAGLGPVRFSGMMLADMGADVIRIDRATPPGEGRDGRLADDDDALPINRGRRSVAIDLKRDEGRAIALDLVARADMFIEGFRPGVAERLGIGPAVCMKRNQRLVYGRVTGWGQDGPMAQEPGHDINFLALSGALASFARHGERPVPPVNLLGDYSGGGMFLVIGVLAALHLARTTGVGQVVDAAVIDGVSSELVQMHGRRAQGQWSVEPGTNTFDTGAPWYEVYETADGKHLALGSLEGQFYRALLAGLGIEPAEAPQWDRSMWPALKVRFAEIIRRRTRDEWSEVFAGTDACVTPVLALDEAPTHAHNRAREVFLDEGGRVQPSPGPRFSVSPLTVGDLPPRVGQQTIEILELLGRDRNTIEDLLDHGVVSSTS